MKVRRRIAGRMLLAGKGVSEVAQLRGTLTSSVSRWKQTVEQHGIEALAAKPHPGKRPKLSDVQKRQLLQILAQGARTAVYGSELWTCPRVGEVILQNFGGRYHIDHAWKLLRKLGYTP